jgi:ATP synthase protein I
VQANAPQRNNRQFFRAAQVASLGLEMGLAVVIGWGVGTWLDGKAGTKPWLMLLFLMFGIAAGFKGIVDAARKISKGMKQDDQEPKSP